MNLNNLSAKKICRLVSAGMVFSMLVITGIFGGIMQDIRIFIVGGTLTLCAFFWIWLLVLIFGKRLSHFTSNLCRTLDNMIDGNEELQKSNDSETLFARINHRLIRLYEIMQKNRHKLENMPNNLSGGQQQRVAIARALITKPAIILADEPTGNLDSKTSADVLGLLKHTSGEFNQTIVMITHNNEIAQLADRIVRIEDGKIVG